MTNFPLSLGRFRFNDDRPLIMGVVNLTPDSFSGGRQYDTAQQAIDHAHQMVEAGADIVDFGAESTRPGAIALTPGIEQDRLLPVLAGLGEISAAVSVDTRHADTMRAVLRYPVDLINDVNALFDEGAVEAVHGAQVGICLMHMRGNPLTMQQAPVYQSVVSEIGGFLHSRVCKLRSSGIAADRLIVDPGIGFGKTLTHNLELLKQIRFLETLCGCPVLIGLSRKSMIGELTGKPVTDRLGGSIGGALAALVGGARVLRVHDVAATRDALTVFKAIISGPSRPLAEQETTK